MPGSIINLTDEAVQRDQGFGSFDKRAERKDLAPEVDIHQPDDLKRLPAAPEADVDGCSVGRGPTAVSRSLRRAEWRRATGMSGVIWSGVLPWKWDEAPV